MTHNTLRHYQLSHVNRILRQVSTHNEAALVSCVGSGKTLTASVVGSEAMNRGIVNRVICATPFTTIAEEFKRYTGSHWASNAQNNSQFTVRPIVEDEGVKHVADVVKCSDEFLVTTHAAMANKKVLKAIDEAEDLSGLLLMIDEAHHCFSSEDEEEDKDGTLLGVAARKILARGRKVLYITATPYRNSGGTTNLIFDPNLCNPVVRTIGEQMREGLAPAMHVEYMHVQDMTLTNAGQSVLFGDGVSTRIGDTQLKHALPIIREKWIADGCPKAILIIPAGNSEHTAKAVASYFTSQGFPEEVATIRGRGTPNVLEAVGTDKQRILAGLTADKEACGHMFDLVVACRKFDEGTDVNTASHLYMIGLPSNVRLFHQRAGRVLRDKKGIQGYDAWFGTAWNEQSRVVFFAPAGKKTKEFDFKVGRQLLHCIFAAESYQEYCEALNFSQSIRISFENEEVAEEDKGLVDDLMARLADIELSSMKDQSSDEYELLVGSTLCPGETVLDKVLQIKADASLSTEDKAKAYSLLLNHLPDGSLGAIDVSAVVKSLLAKAKAKKFVKDEASETFDLTPSELICEEFEEILKRFNTDKVASSVDAKAKSVYAAISGHDFHEWADQCRQYMGEEGALSRALDIISFTKSSGFFPSQGSSDPAEFALAKTLTRMRAVKAGKAPGAWYQSCDVKAKAAGLPELFNQQGEATAIANTREVLQFIKRHGRTPSMKLAESEQEKYLSGFLSRMRSAKRGTAVEISFYPGCEEMAISEGVPDLFESEGLEESAILRVRKLIDFVRDNSRKPLKNAPSAEEPQLYNLIQNLRNANSGNKGTSVLYPSCRALLEEAGMTYLLQVESREDVAMRRALELIGFVKESGRQPKEGASGLERDCHNFVQSIRRHRVRKGVSLHPLAEAYLVQQGMGDLISTENTKEAEALECTELLISFIAKNKKMPGAHEKKLHTFLHGMRYAKQGKRGTWYPSCEALAISAGLPALFNTTKEGGLSFDRKGLSVQGSEETALGRTQEVIDFYNREGRLPKSGTSGEEGSLAKFLSHKRAAKAGKGRGACYSSCESLAAKAGLPDLFTSKGSSK